MMDLVGSSFHLVHGDSCKTFFSDNDVCCSHTHTTSMGSEEILRHKMGIFRHIIKALNRFQGLTDRFEYLLFANPLGAFFCVAAQIIHLNS